MSPGKDNACYRILVIDDNTSIHQDFLKILTHSPKPEHHLRKMESVLFGAKTQIMESSVFEIDCASQGREGLAMVQTAKSENRPYALAFVDGRMPPGWDGIETIRYLWQVCPDLQVVLCTAYSDYSWQKIRNILGETDSLLILKKPFDNVEVLQLAHALTRKWELNRQIQTRIYHLNHTVRKKTEEKEHLGLLLEAALDHSTAGIIIYDAKDRAILWSNAAAIRILGSEHSFFRRKTVVGTGEDRPETTTDGLDSGRDTLPLLRAMKKGETVQNEEFMIRGPQGNDQWISLNAAPISDPGKPICAGILVFQDITRHVLARKEREKMQTQLFQSQKMESLGLLAGGVAHDFNNLLYVIGGNIELLLKGKKENHKDVHSLQAIEKSVDRAAQLVRQLLQFTHKTEVKRQRIDVNHEVRETVKMLERIIPRMITVQLNLDPSAWPINADPTQIEQVLLNLVTNAVDAISNDGRLDISIKNQVVDPDFSKKYLEGRSGQYVLMTVSDTGCGMDKQTLRHIFDPFFTTKKIGRGTGLGLASVYGIVQGHQGLIQCSSRPGAGTTFNIYWPAMPIPEPEESLSRSVSPRRGSGTILIVDDEAMIRDVTGELLQSFGYSVLNAASGEEALALYPENASSIDLILLDLSMPGIGGYQTLVELMRHDPRPCVLVSSGYSSDIGIKELTRAGAAGFIGKPYKLTKLVTAVQTVLDSKGQNFSVH